MKRRRRFLILLAATAMLTAVGSGKNASSVKGTDVGRTLPATTSVQNQAETTEPVIRSTVAEPARPAAGARSAPIYSADWMSINGGGATSLTGTLYETGITLGQSVAGDVSGTPYSLGVGFWYEAVSEAACPIVLTGDVDLNASLTAADIISLVNYVFKSGPDPAPYEAAGDADCSGFVTASDVIFMVNHVFKSGPIPCDVCTLIPGTWSCTSSR